jgi:hypothetical protein
VTKLIHYGELLAREKPLHGPRLKERGATLLHHTTWHKYKQCYSKGKLLDVNGKSIMAITDAVSMLSPAQAKKFWVSVILEDMAAFPFAVEKLFFTQVSEPGYPTPFGNPVSQPMCVVKIDTLLTHFKKVMALSGSNGLNMQNTRRAAKQGRLTRLESWANNTASRSVGKSESLAKEILAAAYASGRSTQVGFSASFPLHSSWNKAVDYRYYRLWASKDLPAERMDELHIPCPKEIRSDIKAQQSDIEKTPGTTVMHFEGSEYGLVRSEEEDERMAALIKQDEELEKRVRGSA